MEILNKVGRLSAQEMLEKIEKAALINYGLHRYPCLLYTSFPIVTVSMTVVVWQHIL